MRFIENGGSEKRPRNKNSSKFQVMYEIQIQ